MAVGLGEQAIQVEGKIAKVTAETLIGIVKQLIENQGKIAHGEQSLQKLNLQGKKLESVTLTGDDIKAFRRELNKYAVDFSVKRDPDTKDYTIFFKGQDVDRVYAGLKKCVENFGKDGKKPVKESMREAEEKATRRETEKPDHQHERADKEREAR